MLFLHKVQKYALFTIDCQPVASINDNDYYYVT